MERDALAEPHVFPLRGGWLSVDAREKSERGSRERHEQGERGQHGEGVSSSEKPRGRRTRDTCGGVAVPKVDDWQYVRCSQYGLPIFLNMAIISQMKTTVDIADALLERAKKHARRTHQPLRVLIEQGLLRVLEEESKPHRYRLPDLSVGQLDGENPLEKLSWPNLRDEIYGGW